MILESRTTDAIQTYGIEKVNAIIQRDNALCGKYILPICRYVYDEKNDIDKVLPVIRMVDKTQGVDIYSLSFEELRNQLNVNKPDDYIPLPNPFYFSSDKTVEIGHITSWDESKEIPQAKSWCISRKEESWNDFVKNRGYRFFIIRDSKCFYKKNARHVIVSVAKNGSWWFVDSTDDTMVDYHIGNQGDHHMLKSDYIKSIGEGAMKAIQDKITTNENKRYKNMNRKNTIRLTESELKNIIAESVKNILKEGYDDEYDFQEELIEQIRNELFSVLEKYDNHLLDSGVMTGWAYEYISYIHKILKQILPYNQWIKQNKN